MEIIEISSSSPARPITRELDVPLRGAPRSSSPTIRSFNFDIDDVFVDLDGSRDSKRRKIALDTKDDVDLLLRQQQSSPSIDVLDLDLDDLLKGTGKPFKVRSQNRAAQLRSIGGSSSPDGGFWSKLDPDCPKVTSPAFSSTRVVSRCDKVAALPSKALQRPFSFESDSERRNDVAQTAVGSEVGTARHSTTEAMKAGKELLKEQKRLEKERKAEEKQKANEIAGVNRSRVDKKDSAKEMSLFLSSHAPNTTLRDHVEAVMGELEVDFRLLDDEIDLSAEEAEVGSLFMWRRKVDRVYDKHTDQYNPITQIRIEQETHMMIHMTGREFVLLASRYLETTSPISDEAMKANVDIYLHKIRRRHAGCKLILLIEGLKSFLNKNNNARSREFVAAARALAPSAPDSSNPDAASSSSSRPKARRTKPSTAQDLAFFAQSHADVVLLHMQIAHPDLLIHQTLSARDSAHQIQLFTSTLSIRPAKLNQQFYTDAHAGFCMESGQIKTADTRNEIFVLMLQQLPRITESMAWGIVQAGYGGVRELMTGFRETERAHGRQQAKLMLQEVKKAVNKSGDVSNRNLGPRVSARLWRAFNEANQWVADV